MKRLLTILFYLPCLSLAARESWFYEAQDAAALIRKGHFTLLDARPVQEFLNGHLARSAHAPWEKLAASPTGDGRLLTDTAKATRILQSWGVRQNKPVLVIGDAINGWGEDGRIAWALRSYGKNDAYIVNGGLQALQKTGLTLANQPNQTKGDFTARLNPQYLAQTKEIRQSLNDRSFILFDTREEREYRGETPYGENRGGHLPGAIHLHFRELTDSQGRLLPRRQVEALLAGRGIDKKTTVIPYCTGGIRSAWVTAALRHYGYRARNYAGSMWEWTALPADKYPVSIP